MFSYITTDTVGTVRIITGVPNSSACVSVIIKENDLIINQIKQQTK